MAQRTRGRSRRRGWRAGVALAVAAAVAVGAVVIWRAGGMTDGAELVEHRAEASFDDAEAATVPRDAPVGTDNGATQDPATLVVDVDGAVMSPGVYELAAEGARVRDAIAAAGGLAEDADTTQLNLATLLQDGQKVHVPRMGEAPSASPTTDTAGRTNAAPPARQVRPPRSTSTRQAKRSSSSSPAWGMPRRRPSSGIGGSTGASHPSMISCASRA